MDDINTAEIKKITDKLITVLEGKVTWKWDDRFEMALTEFDISIQDTIKTILENDLKNVWDSSVIGDAPDIVQQLVKKFKGLHAGQLLFTEDTEREDFLYCVWWPWGNGNRISIRIAPAIHKQSESDNGELIGHFKESFNI